MPPVESVPKRVRLGGRGSCVMRDAFESREADLFALAKYIARSVLVVSWCVALALSADFPRIDFKFQRRMVEDDILKMGRIGLFVVDLIDERLPGARFEGGGVATSSNGFRPLGVPVDRYTKTDPMSEHSLSLWSAGYSSLVAPLDIVGVGDRVAVHCAHWTSDATGNVEMEAFPEKSLPMRSTCCSPPTSTRHRISPHASFSRCPLILCAQTPIIVGSSPRFRYVPDHCWAFLRQLDGFQQRL